MEYSELILKRRSVRKYAEGKTMDRADVEQILKAAQMAPTWKNSQTGRYYVALSEESKDALRQNCLPLFNANSSSNACALIVTTFVRDVAGHTEGKPDNEMGNQWGAYDLGLQNAYLVLKARELGYDTLIMGIRDGDALREQFSIPENEDVAAVIAVGYRVDDPELRPRLELSDVAKFF